MQGELFYLRQQFELCQPSPQIAPFFVSVEKSARSGFDAPWLNFPYTMLN